MKVHRIYIIILSFIFLLISQGCKVDNKKILDVKKASPYENKTIILSKNEKIIIELKKMKKALKEKDKMLMTEFFNFPTKNFLFIRKTNEVLKKMKLNDNKISKSDFLKYSKLSNKNEHPSLYNLLITLDLDLLKNKNNVQKDVKIVDDECYYIYQIDIDEDILTISYGTNSSETTDEGDCSEYSIFLYFTIKNDNIIFKKSDTAG